MSDRRFSWLPYWLSLVVIIVLAALPIIGLVIAGTIADANGCRVDEGSVHPCIVGGVDMGSMLYSLGVLGWMMLLSIPGGILAVGVWVIVLIVHRAAWQRSNPS